MQQRVHHDPEVIGVLAAARVEHRLQQLPLVIVQVTWVRHAAHGDAALHPGIGTPTPN
ncbi:hypothetical protein [Nocardioides sp.]|uniref:hypothetical protein n=1 Tax=Nocardioides sp. TaxID=35761 RepID=UPI002EDA8EFC